MPANGPVIYAAADTIFDIADDQAHALSSLNGVNYDEQLSLCVIEAVVVILPQASMTAALVVLYEGPALTGTERQVWNAPATLVAAADQIQVPIRYLDSKPSSAGVTYSLAITGTGAADVWTVTVYGFTATLAPGGVVPLPSND